MAKETMHFNSFQEMLDFINGKEKAKELKEYKEPKKTTTKKTTKKKKEE